MLISQTVSMIRLAYNPAVYQFLSMMTRLAMAEMGEGVVMAAMGVMVAAARHLTQLNSCVSNRLSKLRLATTQANHRMTQTKSQKPNNSVQTLQYKQIYQSQSRQTFRKENSIFPV